MKVEMRFSGNPGIKEDKEAYLHTVKAHDVLEGKCLSKNHNYLQ